mgnify:CR=1 FL=1|jgi:hypothetical protein|nr:MAG TPA: hypothetical protein [Caudoviricetes sp.]
MSKVSMRSLDRVLNRYGKVSDTKTIQFGIEDDVVEIEVRTMLSLSEARDLVDLVVGAAFTEDESGTMIYSDLMQQYAWNLAVLTYFTNIKPDLGAERLYTIIYKTDLLGKVLDCISARQTSDLLSAITREVRHIANMTVNTQSVRTGELMDKIDTMMSAVTVATNGLQGFDPDQLHEAVAKMADMEEGKILDLLLKEGDRDVETSETADQ